MDFWSATPLAEQWEKDFRRLERYVALYGTALVPGGYRDTDGFGLGLWVRGLRDKRRMAALDRDRRNRLESLPGWAWNPSASTWNAICD